ncbi:ABC-type antimicrobial peptide transport system, permease component [hydrothermal vent metagenome]|uniref:ABC-type antimicrobial peptide transport system, permease component n=1 Tax=hydrothermal vent metagenome TaxID=652676 RepID=A0A3B0V867_9ZZZZ
MNISQNIIISEKILLAHKVRTALSLSGIVIGICAVIIMVSIGRGTEQKIISQLTGMGSDLLIVNSGRVKIIAGRARQTKSVTTLEARDAAAIIAQALSISRAAPAQSKKLLVKYGNLSTRTTIMGTTPDIIRVRNYALRTGRFFDEEEDKGRRRVAVLGQTVVENIFGKENPVGKTIRLGRVPFEVIGVLAPKGLDINGTDQDDLIIIPLRTALRRLFNLTYINTIYVQARNNHVMHRAESEIRTILRATHHLRRGKADDFTIQNQTSVIEAQRESSRAFTLLTSSIAAVSLLVGGIGILAVMLISIRERIKEIGVRRAVGARKSDILTQFMAESLLLSIGGGAIGIILGLTVTAIIAFFAHWPFYLPFDLIAISFLATIFMGILFGVYPAKKAADLDPIKALQFE